MTLLDYYNEVVSRLGDGEDIEIQPRLNKSDSVAFTDKVGLSYRYFVYKGDCLRCAWQEDCVRTDGWAFIEIWCPDGEFRVYDGHNISYSAAMECISPYRGNRFSSYIEV